MMIANGFLYFHLALLCGFLLLPTQICSKKAHGNPAKEIVEIINQNRTALKLPTLYDSPGLGCMALQYADECKDNCTSNNTVSCRPLEDDFTEIFAPDCGVELPTFSTISGHIVGCRSKYLAPSEAFSEILVRDKKSLALLNNRTHTEVGVGVVSTHKGNFFWCVLFSNGQSNSSFVLEDRGIGIQQKQGCFSGTNTTCNEANRRKKDIVLVILLSLFSTFSVFSMATNVDILLF